MGPEDQLTRRGVLSLAAMAATSPLLASAAAPDDIFVRNVGAGQRSWILLHPFSASGRFWETRAAALAQEHGVKLVSPDLPSHGRSKIVAKFDYDLATDAIAAALAPHRDATTVIVGASSGGLVAMKLAARWSKPVAAIGVGLSFSAANFGNMREQSRQLPPPAEQFATAFLEQGAPQLSAIKRHYGDLANLGEQPLLTSPELAALAGRALIVNGAADSFFARASAQLLADAIPASVLSLVTGADHLEPLAPRHREFTWAQIAAFAKIRIV